MGKLDFLNQYESVNTVKAYNAALKNFFEMVYGEREPLEALAERYFQEKRDYEVDIQNFLVHLKELAPKSVRLKITAIRVFLLENDVELPQRFWRRLRGRIKGNRALTLDKVPSNVELRSIVAHMPIHGKALALTLSSSGMRIGEALQLKLEDLDLSRNPAKVSIRREYTKTGNPRTAFINGEAREAIEEWLKVRNGYLMAAVGKSHMYAKPLEDTRLYPFEGTTAYRLWSNALKKARFKKRDKRTNRHTIHPHVLRKFFRTKMATLIPVDIVEALMGHEGYLTEVYRRYSLEDLAKFYLQGESALLVFTEAEEVGKLRAEVEERKRQLQVLVNGLTAENLEMKSKVAKVELENTNLRREVAELQQGIANVTKMVEKLVNPD